MDMSLVFRRKKEYNISCCILIKIFDFYRERVLPDGISDHVME